MRVFLEEQALRASVKGWSRYIYNPVFVKHVSPQAAALGEVLLALVAREGPFARVAALVAVEVARVGEGSRAHAAAEGALARVHPRVDAHVAAAAAPIATLVALERAAVVDGVEARLRPLVPGNYQGNCATATIISMFSRCEGQVWPKGTRHVMGMSGQRDMGSSV